MTIIQANKFYFPRWGADRYMIDVSRALAVRGHRIIPFAMNHPQNLPTPYAKYFPSFVQTERVEYGWQALRTMGRMFYSLEARRKLAHLITDTKPDMCHLHNIYAQISPSILHTLHAQGVPTVMTVHDHHLISPQYDLWAPGCGPDIRGMGLWRAARTRFHKHSFAASFLQAALFAFHRRLRLYERFVDLFLCPSASLAGQLDLAGFPKEKIRVLPFGIECEKIRPAYDHAGYVLFVGRLASVKGVETVVEAARALPAISFRIAGTGPQEATVRTAAHDLPNVVFLGYLSGEALEAAYAGALAVLVPSRMQETFGLVALEAMARGKPVIASATGALLEVVEDRHTGFLVPPLEMAGWVEAIRRLASDEPLRQAMAHHARIAAETRFDATKHFEGVIAAYEEVKRNRLAVDNI